LVLVELRFTIIQSATRIVQTSGGKLQDFRDFKGLIETYIASERPDLYDTYTKYVYSVDVILRHTSHDRVISPFVALGVFLRFHNLSKWHIYDEQIVSFFEQEKSGSNDLDGDSLENIDSYKYAVEAMGGVNEREGSFVSQILELSYTSRQKVLIRAFTRVTLLAMLAIEEGFRIRLTQKEIDDLYLVGGRVSNYLGAVEASAEELGALRILILKQAGNLSFEITSEIDCDWEDCLDRSEWRIRCPKHSTTEFMCGQHFRSLIYSNPAVLVNFTKTCKHTLDYRHCFISSLNPDIDLQAMGY
jgi:hypothetical protein